MLLPQARPLLAMALILPLCACGGGGGGGGGTVSPNLYTTPSVNFAPFIGSFEAEGITSHLVLNTDTSGILTGSGTVAHGSTRRVFTVTTATNPTPLYPDEAQVIQFNAPGVPSPTNVTGEIQSNGAGQYTGYGDGSNGSTLQMAKSLKSSLGATSLSYSYVGAASSVQTATSTSSDTYASAYFGGQKTINTDMPANGTATYSGAYNGVFLSAVPGSPLAASVTDGTASMTSNFGSGTVNGRVDDYRNIVRDSNGSVVSSSPISASLTFSGTITGNKFTGTAGAVQRGTDTPLAGYTQTGTVQGGFFGPQAAEAAGALAIRADIGSKATLAHGVFGLKKN
ncbi:MAG: hypothetical protein JWN07_276 [Hyphomicrobiales bacterium]|nr:hypothetical protein [Hyphomicrobiales bacterium]